MNIREVVFVGFLGAMWAISIQNAGYFGLSQPWGALLMVAGAVLLGIAAPNYRRSGA